MLKLVEPAQMGSEHAADWSRVGGAVSVAADGAKHRTNLQASPATDAIEDIALFDISEQFAPAIVEQDDVKFFGAVHLVWLPGPANQSVIAGDWLAGARRRKHRPKQRKILQPRNHLFDARERHMNAGHAGAEAAIAFVRRDGNHSRIGNKEIRAADSHFG